jgi:hypothetical protein
LTKPHLVNKRRELPISRKRILGIGLVSIFITLVGFSSVMAATEPASIKASIAASALAAQKAQDLINSQHKVKSNPVDATADKTTTKQVTETRLIPFLSTTTNDVTLENGQTQVSVEGVDGITTITYLETYINGKQTSRVQTSSEITTQPVEEVTLVGTYVAPETTATQTDCPNGSYVNSSGDTVCSPYSAPSAPTGATAQCNDGTYSFSQHHSGTCSGHGGVATWL